MVNVERYLNPTNIIDSNHPSITNYALKLTETAENDISKACALFKAVRDDIIYDPFSPFYLAAHYQASNVLNRKSGYCVSKACLLCALGRTMGIPTRLGFADIRNYGASKEMTELMGTNIFTFHGFVEFFLENRWVKATPAFDPSIYEKHNIPQMNFDGCQDSVFPSHDLNGNIYVEYIKYHGFFADLPLNDLLKSFRKNYTDERVDQWIQMLDEES